MQTPKDSLDILSENLKKIRPRPANEKELADRIMGRIQDHENSSRKPIRIWIQRLSSAAAAVLLLLFIYQKYFVLSLNSESRQEFFVGFETSREISFAKGDVVDTYRKYVKNKKSKKEYLVSFIKSDSYENE